MPQSADGSPETFLNILGVLYLHRRTAEGGDLYLTPFGLAMQRQLDIANWLEPEWFQSHRERLEGTSTVYRVQTRPVDGRSADLVVKYCRVGEDVPMNTHTMREFMNAEFNSPWEEFALVMELRESRFGPRHLRIATQEPLAIHVPPEHLQLWQTGRSEERVNRIQRRHPGVALDILKQYQLVYGWIPGLDLMQILRGIGPPGGTLEPFAWSMNAKVLQHLDDKGYAVADMKPVHIIFNDEEVVELRREPAKVAAAAEALIDAGRYSVIDYELLQRTQVNEVEVNRRRRHSYLDILRDRFVVADLPPNLHRVEILGVPFIHGHVESTGGELWVVGRNAGLFDFFLPERWRRTPSVRLSERNDVHYTLSKDHVHLVWKVSQVGELPEAAGDHPGAVGRGFNSPFEECAVAFALAQAGVPTTNLRAIYRTGSRKLEMSQDPSRYRSHADIRSPDGTPVLRESSNYVLISGYFNGPDIWVAQREGMPLCRPMDLGRAVLDGRLPEATAQAAVQRAQGQVREAGLDASLLDAGDLVIAIDPDGRVLCDAQGEIEARICDFSFISMGG